LGSSTTLPEGEQYLRLLVRGRNLLITNPGPCPDLCVPFLAGAGQIFLLAVPGFDTQMPESWHRAIPADWRRVTLEEARAMLPGMGVLHYTPASRLLPAVYAPLLARLRPFTGPPAPASLWIPAPENALIVPELEEAAREAGLVPRRLPARLAPRDLARFLDTEIPALFLSVNFHGLDPWGENQAILEAAGVPVAAWCVDNPLHLLTNQKTTLWKKLRLFVTDDWFLTPLRELGAEPVHLPLGTSGRIFAPGTSCPSGRDLTFAGRSSFPDRDRFFAAARIPDDLARAAAAMDARDAHFGWWRDRLQDIRLWPGNDVRIAGLGAETSSAVWRTACLRVLSGAANLTIIGDEAWQSLVPLATRRPPVDYYGGLADAYRRASFTLNLTSLLLPHGLTQRHFDVWACGGFLLTDDTPGLGIFPRELSDAVSFRTPEQAAAILDGLAATPKRKEELRRAWQKLVLSEHTYAARLQSILDACGLR
jgi:hypothetical protein